MKTHLTTADVAAELRVSEETVRGYVREGVIPVERTPGGHARYDMERVRAALELRPRVRRLRPLEPGEIRLGAGTRSIPKGSLARDMRIGGLDLTRGEGGDLPTWPGRPGSARVVGRRSLVEA